MGHNKDVAVVDAAVDGGVKFHRERDAWLDGQREALELAVNGAPLEASLGVLVRTAVEAVGSGARAGFYLANDDCTALHHVVGMPADYAEAVDGFKVGPDSLACGLATSSGKAILTADVRRDPLWQPWLWMAEKFDYRACWSFPIHSPAERFYGTLAIYSRAPRAAARRDQEVCALLTRTASIIISRHKESEARRRAEQSLRESEERYRALAEALELRVQERTASLQEAVAQMEEFSYTVSHDLRAPLRAMQAYSSALLTDFAAVFEAHPQATRYLDKISAKAKRLDRMILDVLTFSRVARSELRMQRVPLDRVVREVIEHYPDMQPPKSAITVEPLQDVLGHEPSLTQAVSNLLANAVKFVPPAARPEVRVWTEDIPGGVRLNVQDNGIGIEREYHGRLFKMFERIHPDLPYDGTGVGLAIVRRAVERMGGSVGVESRGAGGSRFWIELKRAQPA